MRETALAALENQDLPFECLVREFRPERDQSRNPLFQVTFNHHRSFAQAGHFGGVSLTPIPSRSPGTIFDLHFFMVERKEGWRTSCDYSSDLFARSSADRMLGHFKRLLEDIAAHPQKPIDELEILTDPEKHAILADWSGPRSDYPRDRTIGELFVETATRFPQRTAIDSGGQSLTYQQLHAEASQLARSLIDLGAGPGKLLAISAKPSPEMIVGFLAILLAGACCVPIDPDYPADRLALLLEDCDPETALATAGSTQTFSGGWKGKVVVIAPVGTRTEPTPLPEIPLAAADPAYLLFTSGSTGRPKGVLIAHRGIARLVRNNGFMPITPEDVFLQAAPVSFDASLLEIWGPLLNGGRLVLLPDGPSLGGIAGAVRDQGVTTLWLTSGLFQLMIDGDHQVKIRGFRIEPGEIETALTQHPDVSQAKVAIRGEGAEGKRILAWVIPSGGVLSENDLARFLATRLPAFMRPESIGIVPSFPLNANGKIDVAALPEPDKVAAAGISRPAAPPAGAVEIHLAVIWQELLGLAAVNRDDDFFALGGHSLMALRMFSRINREFGKSLPLAVLLQHPTIATLAVLLAPAADLPAQNPVVTLAEGGKLTPLFCIHGGDGGVLFYRDLAKLLPEELPIHAIESLELGGHGKVNPLRIEETAATYVRSLLAIQPHGPFRLAGDSFGGVVAHEMACQLTAQGHTVEFLGLFDTHNPASPTRNYTTTERLRVFWGQSAGQPPGQRLSLLRARVSEGLHTRRRVRAERLAAASSGPAEAYSNLRRIQVREENWQAMQDYQPGIFSGRITLFKATSVSAKVGRAADYGWTGKSGSGLEIVPVPGEHLTFFAPENVPSLAAALSSALSRISSNPIP